MQLDSITYSQYKNKPEEWRVTDFTFGKINLIVGKNATGKSRTLNIIKALGNLISGDIKPSFESGNYKVIFDKNGEKLKYYLQYEESEVIKEELYVDTKLKLKRGRSGRGKILAVRMGSRFMKFQAPASELACVARRDTMQHPFFEDLYTWGKNLRHYYFGTTLGKDHFAVFKKGKGVQELNLKETHQIVAIFKKGMTEYGNKFIKIIKSDMMNIGYDFKNITVGPLKSITIQGAFEPPQCLLVEESDLKGKTDQNDMSQGMFRALSLLIQLNYSLLASVPSCIIVDDIGEGLDYERSSSLIKLLIEKANKSSVQLIMSTNDRFVMNNVPLEYWSIMKRFPNESKIYNYRNSKKIFDNFALTGLNNFDFFTSEVFGGEGR